MVEATSTLWLVSHVSLWILVAVLVLAVLALARQIGLLHSRIPAVGARETNEGPQIGDLLPHLPELDRPLTNHHFDEAAEELAQSTLFIFLSPRCTSCRDLLPALRSLLRTEKATQFTVVSSEDDAQFLREIRDQLGRRVAVAASEAIMEKLGVQGTPYAIVADKTRVVRGKGIVNNLEHLVSLLEALEGPLSNVQQKLDLSGRPNEAGLIESSGPSRER